MPKLCFNIFVKNRKCAYMVFFIDESGSIDNKSNNDFIICIVQPLKSRRLKTLKRRFVSKNLDRLKELDNLYNQRHANNKSNSKGMFREDGTFKELKGSRLDADMKAKFVKAICETGTLQIHYIRLHNKKLTNGFTENTARTFNYCIKIWLSSALGKLAFDSNVVLNIDERNESPDTVKFLQEYLNTELSLAKNASRQFIVNYFQSENSDLVQVADVLSNIFYSYTINPNRYNKIISILEDNSTLKPIFEFPIVNE